METLDKAITRINGQLRQDPKVDVPMATLLALTEGLYEARLHGWDDEEQATLFDLYGQASLRVAHAKRLTDIIISQTEKGFLEKDIMPVFKPESVFSIDSRPTTPLPRRKPDLFVIPGGLEEDAPMQSDKTSHLYIIHGGRQ